MRPAYTAIDVLGFISFVLLMFLVAGQRLFPKKCNGNLQKTCMALSVACLSSRTMFILFAGPEATLCSSAIESATSATNWRCAAQGFLLIFGTYASALWCSVRSYEVFAVVVFGYNTRTWYWALLCTGICWGIPLIVAVAALGTNSLSFVMTYFCAPRLELQSSLMLWPLIAITIPALVAEIWFLARVMVVFRRSAEQPSRERSREGERNSGYSAGGS